MGESEVEEKIVLSPYDMMPLVDQDLPMRRYSLNDIYRIEQIMENTKQPAGVLHDKDFSALQKKFAHGGKKFPSLLGEDYDY